MRARKTQIILYTFFMVFTAFMPFAIAEIEATRLLPRINSEVSEIVQKTRNSVVMLKRIRKDSLGIGKLTSVGSGIIVDKNGYIITNDHVIADVVISTNKRDSVVLVTLANGKIIEGVIVARDAETDLALVKIPENQCGDFCDEAILFGDSDEIKAGEAIIIIGHPLNFEGTVSHGVISFEKREVDKYDLDSPGNEFLIQTDAAINFGASGGVVVNDKGEALGIVKSTTVQYGLRFNIGFVIPSNNIKVFLATNLYKEKPAKKISKGWIGTESEQLMYEEYERVNHPSVPLNGIVLRSVFKGSPAAKAGLRSGDIIVGTSDKEFFKDEFEFQRYIGSHSPGSVIIMRVFDVRSRIFYSVEIITKERPDALGVKSAENILPRNENKKIGAMLGMEIELLADHKDILTAHGGSVGPHHFYIISVTPKSFAEKAGLRKGDVIIGYDGKSVKDWEKEGFLGKSGFEDYCVTRAGDVIYIAIFRKEGKQDIVTLRFN